MGEETSYIKTIYKASKKHKIDPNLIKAVISVESNWDPRALGDNGQSYGLMQIKLTTAKDISGLKDLTGEMLYRPGVNINLGTKYLAYQKKRYGNYEKAVAAYNAGQVLYKDDMTFVNQGYVNKVNKAYKKYAGRYLYTIRGGYFLPVFMYGLLGVGILMLFKKEAN